MNRSIKRARITQVIILLTQVNISSETIKITLNKICKLLSISSRIWGVKRKQEVNFTLRRMLCTNQKAQFLFYWTGNTALDIFIWIWSNFGFSYKLQTKLTNKMLQNPISVKNNQYFIVSIIYMTRISCNSCMFCSNLVFLAVFSWQVISSAAFSTALLLFCCNCWYCSKQPLTPAKKFNESFVYESLLLVFWKWFRKLTQNCASPFLYKLKKPSQNTSSAKSDLSQVTTGHRQQLATKYERRQVSTNNSASFWWNFFLVFTKFLFSIVVSILPQFFRIKFMVTQLHFSSKFLFWGNTLKKLQ